jgi:hypothetical protein
MGQEVLVYQRPVIDIDDLSGQTAALSANGANSAWTDILTLRTRTGRRARLSLVANAVDPGSETFMLFRILVNGAVIADALYSLFGANNSGATGLSFDPSQRMTRPIDLPQNAYVQFQAMLQDTSSATTYKAYMRAKIEYVDL